MKRGKQGETRGNEGKLRSRAATNLTPGGQGGEQKGNTGMEEGGTERTKGRTEGRTEGRKPIISLKGNYSPLFWRGAGGEAFWGETGWG